MRKKQESHTFIKYFIAIVTILVLALGAYRINYSYEKNLEKEAKISELEAQILAEKERGLKLEKEYDSLNDKDYIENVAREKFGLIYPDEILIEIND